jgi:heme exporter protein C
MKRVAVGLYVAVTVALMIWGFYQAVFVAPLDAMQGEVYRIIFYHVPSASVAFLFFAISLAGSIGYLSFRRSRPDWAQIGDALALAGAEVGVVFCSVVLVTGPIWARRAWGIWWTWDARLTTTLVLWLIYVSYLLLRRVNRCRRWPPFSASLARSMCRLFICRTGGGARSTRLRFLAETPTLAWPRRWFTHCCGIC